MKKNSIHPEFSWEFLHPLDTKIPKGEAFYTQIAAFIRRWEDDSEVMPLKTSGSTGTPKEIWVKKERMLHSARRTCHFFSLQSGNQCLLCLPVENISGAMMLVRAMLTGMKLWAVPPSSDALSYLNREVDFMAITPLQAHTQPKKVALSRQTIIGGAQVSAALYRCLHSALAGAPVRVYETYGMTETLSHIALREVFPQAVDSFQPLPEVELSVDSRGCLEISAQGIIEGTIVTNDMVDLKEDGSFQFLGRKDFIINSGGAKISPEPLENTLTRYFQKEVFLTSVNDEVLGQKLILVLEEPFDPKPILHQIPWEKSYHKPKAYFFTEKFPRRPNGKIDRPALREMASQALKSGNIKDLD